MYQPWSTGRHLIQKFTHNGINHTLVFQCQKDSDPNATLWWDWICTGDWAATHPLIIVDMENATMSGSEIIGKTPDQYVYEKVIVMNKYLTDYFGGIMPTTWAEKVEAIIQNLSVSSASGVPQIILESRSWGLNPSFNKWLAARTGYSGNFAQGQFSSWAAANGWNVQALTAEYNQLP